MAIPRSHWWMVPAVVFLSWYLQKRQIQRAALGKKHTSPTEESTINIICTYGLLSLAMLAGYLFKLKPKVYYASGLLTV